MPVRYRIPRAPLALAALLAAGCSSKAAAPPPDLTPPKIILNALGAVGNPVFASDEAAPRKEACARFRAFPARFVLSVGDAGGVALAVVRVSRGRIVAESVIVAPDAPESTWEISRLEGMSEMLMIRLAKPAGGAAATTGLLGMFNVVPDALAASVTASAYDHSGNLTNLYPVGVRPSGDDTCR